MRRHIGSPLRDIIKAAQPLMRETAKESLTHGLIHRMICIHNVCYHLQVQCMTTAPCKQKVIQREPVQFSDLDN